MSDMPDDFNNPEPDPKPAEGPAMWDLVMQDMQRRDHNGANKYGMRLRAEDGRDGLVDAYQELLDAAVYLRKEIYRRYGR